MLCLIRMDPYRCWPCASVEACCDSDIYWTWQVRDLCRRDLAASAALCRLHHLHSAVCSARHPIAPRINKGGPRGGARRAVGLQYKKDPVCSLPNTSLSTPCMQQPNWQSSIFEDYFRSI